MEEKKNVKISLTGLLLIFAIIVIVILSFLLYKVYSDKKVSNEKVGKLDSELSNLNEKVNEVIEENEDRKNVVEKEDVNVLDDNLVNESATQNKNLLESTNNVQSLSGEFAQNPPNVSGYWFDAGSYIFKTDGTVENAQSYSKKGTYTINGNVINIHFTEMDGEPIDETHEFLIKDDDTILMVGYKTEENNPICYVSGTVFYKQNDK